MSDQKESLYDRLGGYDGITQLAADWGPKVVNDPVIGRYWKYRGKDGIARQTKLTIDHICHFSGGPVHYAGRDMVRVHEGMKINDEDWQIFIKHVHDTLDKFEIGEVEKADLTSLFGRFKSEIVE